jgi:hypothetical protein
MSSELKRSISQPRKSKLSRIASLPGTPIVGVDNEELTYSLEDVKVALGHCASNSLIPAFPAASRATS